MNFENLTLENFMSWENVTIPLSKQGLVLVRGENEDSTVASSNGSGKSSAIVDGWLWVIFGRTARKVSGSKVVRRGSSGCRGALTFTCPSGSYRIERYQDHPTHKNSLFLLHFHSMVTIDEYVDGSVQRLNSEDWQDITKSDKRETQKLIEDLIGFPMQVALNAMILGQNSIAFATMTDAEKKATFERVLEFDKFTNAGKRAKEKVKELELEISSKGQLVESYTQQLTALNETFNDLSAKSRIWKEEREQKRREYETRLMEVKKVLQRLQAMRETCLGELISQKEKQDLLQLKFASAQKAHGEATTNVHSLQAELASFGDELLLDQRVKEAEQALESRILRIDQGVGIANANAQRLRLQKVDEFCPTCGQDLLVEQVIKARESLQKQVEQVDSEYKFMKTEGAQEIASYIEVVTVAKDKLSQLQNAKQNLSERFEHLGIKQKECSAQTQSIMVERHTIEEDSKLSQLNLDNNSTEIRDYENEFATLNAALNIEQTDPFTVAIDRAKVEIVRIKPQLNSIKTEVASKKNKLKLFEFWVRGFGKSGIQSYMLDSLVPFLNERVEKYSKVMFGGEVDVEFKTQRLLSDGETLKEDFHLSVINRNGSDVYLGNSAGEQERIDICVALGLQDLVASRKGSNFKLCIFDEVARHLDPEGVESYYGLLQEIAREKDTTFVITHSPHLEALFDRVWVVTKQGGISRLAV